MQDFAGGAVAEIPCGADGSAEGYGSFDCGCASLSRSTTFAQDDNLELFLRLVLVAAAEVVDEHLFYGFVVGH